MLFFDSRYRIQYRGEDFDIRVYRAGSDREPYPEHRIGPCLDLLSIKWAEWNHVEQGKYAIAPYPSLKERVGDV